MQLKEKKIMPPLVRRVLVFGSILTGVLAVFVVSASMTAQKDDKLSKHDRELLATARANGDSTVTLLIAAKPGANKAVVSGLIALGGKIAKRDDDVSYIRAIVPISKVEAAARLNGIEAIDLDEIIPLEDPRPVEPDDNSDATPNPDTPPSPAVDPPGPGTPGENAYMPTRDIGAPQFVAANPTFDGRGVKIGVLDSGVDLLTPELQTAKALDGTPTRKIADWVTYTDPLTDNDPTWINMQAQVVVSGGSFTYNNASYIAPANGNYRIGLFDERVPTLGGELGNDVNRDGNPAGSSGIFAVLWNTTSNTVWVDANQNNSFADEQGMTDYKVNNDVGIFGTDNPATATRETIPFVVQTDGKNKFVNIGIVSGAHGTHVTGIAAGKDFFEHPAVGSPEYNDNGPAFDGAAPEAQVVAIRVCMFTSGCTAHALIEGMIFAEKQANVDVINMSIGGLPSLNDGNNTRAVLYNRLIDQYKAQMFISAGNSGAGLNTVGDPSVATKVISVGAYVHQDTWLNNYNAIAAKIDGMFVFSSRGPREDGGFKPEIVAPGAAVSTIPAWERNFPLVGPLPPGYDMFNGTSMASPQSAGAAALLISAAKQTGVQWQPDQLRQAINSSARYLPAYGAYEQGNGLFQVDAAWDLLKTNIKTVGISSSGPVNTALSDFLATPDYGVGIYEREGWAQGQSGQRAITFKRTTGGSQPISYNLSWVGNDGTFSSASSISLQHNTPVALAVDISTATAGVHSAILNLDDPGTTGIDYQVMNTVVAAEQLNAGNSYTVSHSGSADRPDKATFFFNVPANTPAFKVDVTTNSGRVRTIRFHPFGVPFDNTDTTAYCSAGANCQSGQPAGTISRTTLNPTPGVWEVVVDTSRTSAVTPATFTITASLLGASVSPNPDVISSATIGTPIARSYTLTNLFGPFTGRAVGTTLGSARRGVFSIANLEQQQYPVVVTAGTTSLRATIGGPSDPAADLDLFVFNCTTGTCVLAGQNADGDSEESVTINNPAAGTWVVLVDGFSVPAGTTTYNYLDVFTNPAFGSVSVTDANALRPAGASWTVPGTVTANAAPAAGRVLLGNVQVRTDTNMLIGSGDVVVLNVTP
jgi:subtilisin family serine protease